MSYETTFQIEILREYGSSISAGFYHYANNNKINLEERDHPINKARIEARLLANKLTSSLDEEIQAIKQRLHELKAYLYEVNPNAVI